jgi:hypothetical protein
MEALSRANILVQCRIDRAKRGCRSGTSHSMMMRRSVCQRTPHLLNLTQKLPVNYQVRLRGEVHRLVAPRDQKYQSNFVEVR